MRTSVSGGKNAVWMLSQTKLSNVRNNLGSSLRWLRFENPDVPNHKSVAPDRAHPGQNESPCLKKCFPLTLATLSTAGNSKHVEIAHQVAFQLWICMRDERRKDEFNDQQTAFCGITARQFLRIVTASPS
jgi:hypothetical protein